MGKSILSRKKSEENKWLNRIIVGVFLIFILIFLFEWFNTDTPPENIQKAYEGYQESGEIDWELVYGDDWEGYLQEELEEEGYEVMTIFISDISTAPATALYFGDGDKINCESSTKDCVSGKKNIRVKMKSLGSRADQIKRVIFDSLLMDNIYGYWIEILSPTDTCIYAIKLDDWRACLNDPNYPCDSDAFVLDSLLFCE